MGASHLFSINLMGLIFIPVSLFMGFLAYRYYLIRKSHKLLYLLFIEFSLITLNALSCSIAAFYYGQQFDGISTILIISLVSAGLANAMLGYIFVSERLKKTSPWWGFSLVFIPSILAIIFAFSNTSHSLIEETVSGGTEISVRNYLLMALTYYLGVIPVITLFWSRFRRAFNTEVKKHYFFLFLIFLFVLAVSTVNFLLEPFLNLPPLAGELVIIMSAFIIMGAYIVYSEFIIRDIEKKFRKIIENLDELIFIIDNQYKILYANPNAEKTLKFKFRNWKADTVFELIDQRDHSGVKESIVFEATEKLPSIEFRCISIDNEEIWVTANPNLMQIDNWEPGKKAYLLACHDITETKKLHQSLIKAKEEAEESDKLKSVFLATMSHELRTPLNSVIGFSEMLQNIDDLSDAQQYGEYIFKQSNHLMGIIESIFELTRLEGTQHEPKKHFFTTTDLFEELHQMTSSLLARHKKKYLQIKYLPDRNNQDIVLFSDKGKIKQVMMNLLDNAIKFTEKGYINYGFTVDGQTIVFFVKDSGIGIKEENKERIFDRFRQLEHSDTRKYSGIGLGLAIGQKIAEILDGKLYLTSEPGQGSTFYFKLGNIISESDNVTNAQVPLKKYPDLSSNTILVAEDNYSNFQMIKQLLAPTQAKIEHASDGLEAIKMARKERKIDLILMDIKLPEMDGVEARNTIARFLPKVPVIAVTAFAFPGDEKKYLQSGFSAYLSKPIQTAELINLLETFLV